MIRAGLIGCGKGTLGVAWLRVLNGPEMNDVRPEDTRVVAVWDHDAGIARHLASEYKIEAMDSFAEMTSRVDGVIISDAELGRYWEYARPFIEAGVPIYANMPFASDLAMAQQILSQAGEKEAPFMSVSPLYFAQSVSSMKKKVELAKYIETFIVTGAFGEFYRNISHVISVLFGIFGGDVGYVRSFGLSKSSGEDNANESLVIYTRYRKEANYPDLQGVLQLLPTTKYETCRVKIYGQNEILPEIDAAESVDVINASVLGEIESFFKTRHETVSHELMLDMVRTIFAIRLSRDNGREVLLDEVTV